MSCVNIPRRREIDGFDLDLLVLVRVAVLRRRCTGEPVEQIVETAVLLDDDNDVVDLVDWVAKALDVRGSARRRRNRARCNPPLHSASSTPMTPIATGRRANQVRHMAGVFSPRAANYLAGS